MEHNESRKDQIIRSAATLFRTKGYASSSMRDIALVLGIEAASIYSHIKSKEEILRFLCFNMAADFIASLDNVEQLQLSPPEKLRLGIIGHVNVMSHDLIAAAVFMNEYRHLTEPYLSKFLLLRINYINRFKRIIDQGVRNGDFKNAINTKLAVMTLFSSFNWLPLWYSPTSGMNPQLLGDQLAQILITGLKRE